MNPAQKSTRQMLFRHSRHSGLSCGDSSALELKESALAILESAPLPYARKVRQSHLGTGRCWRL